MNTTAVLIGLFYGMMSAVICYVVSMVTSGLFARPFYRLYGRVLIGICSVMLLAPGLRWLASMDPQMATIGLTLAQYLVMAVLGYGVFRFNRNYMKKVFLRRTTTAYFTFGTLANAAIVTLAFLHVAITGAPAWREAAPGYVAAGNYGPLMVLLSAMIFHTDYHLKQSVGDLRRFSRFTFVGYAVSFIGVALSIVPYLGKALDQLRFVAIDSPLLQNFFSVQALLIAILVYAWLVWRYESIPPLFLLLLAMIGEYHVLVTQWVTQSYGPGSWGLASLPLFVGFASLDHYFAKWDQRKQAAASVSQTDSSASGSLRFATPFRLVGIGLAVALFGIALRTRFSDVPGGSPSWLAVTFAIYTLFFLAFAVLRNEAKLVYVSGLLAGLAALMGVEVVGGGMSVALLGGLAATGSAIAMVGEWKGLKICWRTPLTDCVFLSAILVTVTVFTRHFIGDHPYHFQGVGLLDGIALGCAAFAFLVSAYQYRSWLPVFAALIALATTIPPWSAAIGLIATISAALIRRSSSKENSLRLEGRVHLFGVKPLPFADLLPSLFVQPLSLGSIPLALIGLAASVSHVVQGNFSTTVLAGAAISAFVLGLLTRTYRVKWLYIVSLLATYFAVGAIAHGTLLGSWPEGRAISAHLLLVATISLVGWAIAATYASWCDRLIKRVAEAKETDLRDQRAYYAGLLYKVTSIVAVITLIASLIGWLRDLGSPMALLGAAALTSILLAFAASVYRSQMWTYLSLSAFSFALLNAVEAFHIPRWDGSESEIGLCAAALSCFAYCRMTLRPPSQSNGVTSWIKPTPLLQASGLDLWIGPLAVYAIVCSLVGVFATLNVDWIAGLTCKLSSTAPIAYAMTGVALLLCTAVFRSRVLYVLGIAFGFAAAHGAIGMSLDRQDFEGQAQFVHLLLAGGLSFLLCGLALSLPSDSTGWAVVGMISGASHCRQIANSTPAYSCMLLSRRAFLFSPVSRVLRYSKTWPHPLRR